MQGQLQGCQIGSKIPHTCLTHATVYSFITECMVLYGLDLRFWIKNVSFDTFRSYSFSSSHRSVHFEDGEADPVPQGLHPGDATWSLPHFDCCIPLHLRCHSGGNIDRPLLRHDTHSGMVMGVVLWLDPEWLQIQPACHWMLIWSRKMEHSVCLRKYAWQHLSLSSKSIRWW